MKKRLALVIILFCFYSQAVFALDPLGPPVARLKKGQFSAGADYSFSDMDLKGKGKSILTIDYLNGSISYQHQKQTLRLKSIDMHKVYACLGYGITDNWQAFLRLGRANADWKEKGDTHFAIGFGTRVTFYQQDALKLGACAQFSWAESGFDSIHLTSTVTRADVLMSGRLSWQETQIAIGATYKFAKSVSIYGGPFFHFIDGELNLRGIPNLSIMVVHRAYLRDSYDIDEVSYFGGYIGAEIDIAENISYNIEYQHTAAADALGMKLIWRFR